MNDQWTAAEAVALKKALRLTGERFAARLGVSPRTVANWTANPKMVPRLSVHDLLDDLLAAASPDARARFEELTDRSRRVSRPQSRPDDVAALRDTIDNLSARLSLLERLIAGPQTTYMEASSTARN